MNINASLNGESNYGYLSLRVRVKSEVIPGSKKLSVLAWTLIMYDLMHSLLESQPNVNLEV